MPTGTILKSLTEVGHHLVIERYETKKSAEAVSAKLAAPYLGPLCPARASIRDVPDRALAPLANREESDAAVPRSPHGFDCGDFDIASEWDSDLAPSPSTR